jgi:hypothetical protein
LAKANPQKFHGRVNSGACVVTINETFLVLPVKNLIFALIGKIPVTSGPLCDIYASRLCCAMLRT